MINTLEERHFHAFYHNFGRPSYHPKMLLAALLFAYSQGIFSGRKIEKMMIENLAMQYLTGQLLVSYRTINRFRVAEGMEELIRDLFVDLNLRLKLEEFVTLDCLFIDGTKIEANANKYSFVWKKATDKFSAKTSRTDTGLFSRRNHSHPSGHRTGYTRAYLLRAVACILSSP